MSVQYSMPESLLPLVTSEKRAWGLKPTYPRGHYLTTIHALIPRELKGCFQLAKNAQNAHSFQR